MELVHSHCKPIFQHEYALSKLKSNGYKIACASNSIRNSIDIMLKKSDLYDYMDIIYSAEDVVNPKDIETLEDLIQLAVNNAKDEADKVLTSEMSKLTGGLPLPPGMKFPF